MLDTNINKQHLLIVGDGSLFDDGITQLMTHRTDSLVSHFMHTDELALVNTIKTDRPDVILINETGSLDTVHIIDLISSHPNVRGARIVVVRHGNNVVDVYAQPIFVAGKIHSKPRQIIGRTIFDLLNAVRRESNDQPRTRILQ